MAALRRRSDNDLLFCVSTKSTEPVTSEAVREFQRIFNMPVTGSVDFATWYEISEIYVAIEGLAEL